MKRVPTAVGALTGALAFVAVALGLFEDPAAPPTVLTVDCRTLSLGFGGSGPIAPPPVEVVTYTVGTDTNPCELPR